MDYPGWRCGVYELYRWCWFNAYPDNPVFLSVLQKGLTLQLGGSKRFENRCIKMLQAFSSTVHKIHSEFYTRFSQIRPSHERQILRPAACVGYAPEVGFPVI
jgi:hypothetical protein